MDAQALQRKCYADGLVDVNYGMETLNRALLGARVIGRGSFGTAFLCTHGRVLKVGLVQSQDQIGVARNEQDIADRIHGAGGVKGVVVPLSTRVVAGPLNQLSMASQLPEEQVLRMKEQEAAAAAAGAGARIEHLLLVQEMDVAPGHNLAAEAVRIATLPEHMQLPLTIQLVVNLIKQGVPILEGLIALSISHNDIKPDNIHVDTKGNMSFLDLGLATMDGKRSGGGTLAFLDPQSLLETAVTPSQEGRDWFAIGVTAFFLLCQRFPFSRELGNGVDSGRVSANFTRSMRRNLEQTGTMTLDPSWPKDVRERLPAGLAELIGGMLDTDASRRLQLHEIKARMAEMPCFADTPDLSPNPSKTKQKWPCGAVGRVFRKCVTAFSACFGAPAPKASDQMMVSSSAFSPSLSPSAASSKSSHDRSSASSSDPAAVLLTPAPRLPVTSPKSPKTPKGLKSAPKSPKGPMSPNSPRRSFAMSPTTSSSHMLAEHLSAPLTASESVASLCQVGSGLSTYLHAPAAVITVVGSSPSPKQVPLA